METHGFSVVEATGFELFGYFCITDNLANRHDVATLFHTDTPIRFCSVPGPTPVGHTEIPKCSHMSNRPGSPMAPIH